MSKETDALERIADLAWEGYYLNQVGDEDESIREQLEADLQLIFHVLLWSNQREER